MKKKNYFTLLALIFSLFSATFAKAQCQDTTVYLTAFKCESATYTFYSQVLDSPGYYYDTIPTTGGCDSFMVLHLFNYNTLRLDFYDTICQGQSFTYNGTSYSTTGDYATALYSRISPFCDSIVTLHLTVRQSHNDSATINASFCRTGGGPGQGYNFYGQRLYISGTYVHDTIINSTSCHDSIIILHLIVTNQPPLVRQNIGLCTGGSYTINGHTYTAANTYYDTLASVYGCDSVVRTTITISNYVQPAATNATFCSGTYTWRGHTYTSASPFGGYKDTAHATGGSCDTIFTLNLQQGNGINVFPPSQGTICTGGTYTWRGHTYTQPSGGGGPFGGYRDTVPAPGGCDSIFTLILSQGTNPRLVRVDSFCYGTTYPFHGQNYTTAGSDTVYGTTSGNGGCDTMYILRLSYKVAPTFVIVDSFCQGTTYLYGAYSFTTAGTHAAGTRPAPSGCDTVILLSLSYKAAPSISVTDSFCQGSTYYIRDTSFTTSGDKFIPLPTAGGCDTIIHLHLRYKTAPRRTINTTICTGNIYVYGIDTFTQVGNFTITVPAPSGCDSILTIRIGPGQNPRVFLTDSFCAGTTYHYATDSFTTAGRYFFTVASRTGGCDSTIILNLSTKVSIIVNPITASGNILVANAAGTGFSYQWYQNGNMISGAHSQFYTATTSGTYSVVVSNGVNCPGTSPNYTFVTGISDIPSDMFTLYPNPNTGKFTIETQNYSGTDISIYDVYGRLVFQKALASAKEMIDMSNATNGTYYLVMKNQQYSKYAHFVIAQ